MHLLSLVPLLPFTLVFIVGILVQGLGVGLPWVLSVVCIAAAVFWRWKRPYGVLMCCGLLTGYLLSLAHVPFPLEERLRDVECFYSGVAEEVRDYDPTQMMIVRVDSCGGAGCRDFWVKLTVPSSVPAVEERDRISFRTALSPMTSQVDLPDEIDYDAPLRRMGVVASGFVRPDSLRIVGHEPGLLNDIRRLRTDLTLAIVRLPLSASAREFLNVMLTGDRSMLTSDTRTLFSSTGLSHILALSGLHVSLLAWIAALILFPLYICGLRGMRMVIMIGLLWVFAVMTGLAPSVVRSVVMATIFLVSYRMQRIRSPFNSLCAAALIILVLWPYTIYSVGFQLSFIAVASILVFAERLNPFPSRNRFLHSVAAYPSVTLAAMLGTGIVSAFYFNIFPLFFLAANFIAALLLPLILGGGLMLLITDALGWHSGFLARSVDTLFSWLNTSVEWLGSLSGSVVRDVYVTDVTLAAWFLTLVPFALWLHRKRRVYGVATLCCAAFTFGLIILDPLPVYGTEIFIPRLHSHSSLMVRTGQDFHVFTTAPTHSHTDLEDDYRRKYHRYFLKRNLDSLNFHQVSRLSPEIVEVGALRFALIYDRRSLCRIDRGVDYALVCNGFRGDVRALADSLSPDTILLAADLNKRRHDRYLRELTESGRGVRSLKHSPFIVTSSRRHLLQGVHDSRD